MAGPSLRDPFLRAPLVSEDEFTALDAAGMGSLRRGYESGRIGTDVNAQLARESSLRAGGYMAEADNLRAQTEALQRRASIYAPPVQRVEDITGAGTGASWLAGQIGSGAASMQDPVLASAALSAAGTGLSFVPIPAVRLAGAGLRNVAAPLAAYDINRRQLKGEQYGNLSGDAAVTGQYTPQEIDSQASTYGNVAGLIDTAIPAMVGRQLGGAALRARPKMSAAAHVPFELAAEGATEVIQGEGGRMQHTALNPMRDASQDASLRLNEFAGGAAGAGGPVMAGAAAQGLYGAARAVPGAVQEAAGTVVDMAKDRLGPTVEQGMAAAKDGVVDMKARFQAATASKDPLAADEADLMNFVPPKGVDAKDPEAYRAWFQEAQPKRSALIADSLGKMAQAGDPTAAELMTQMQDTANPEGALAAEDTAVKHILDRRGVQELADEAERGVAARGGALAGKAAGKVAGAAVTAGKAAFGAFKGRKLNAQESSAPTWTGDEFEARKKDAMEAFDAASKRADLMGEYLAGQAEAQPERYATTGEKAQHIPGFMREVGKQISNLAETWAGKDAKPSAGKFDRLRYDLNRVANRLVAAYGPEAPRVVAELQGMADPKAKALFGHLNEELAVASGPGGVSRTIETQQQAYDGMLKGIDQGKQTELLREGVDLRNPRTRQQMVRMIEAAANGQLKPSEREALSGMLGPNNLQRAIQAFMPRTPEQDAVESAYETAAPLDKDNDTTDYDKRQAEKLVGQRAGASVYSLQGLKPQADQSLSGKSSDPMRFRAGYRPRLYDLRPGEESSALLKKAEAELSKHLGGDTSWDIQTRSALEDMAQREGISLQTALGPYAGGNKVTEGGISKLDPDKVAERMGVNTAFIDKIITRYRDFMKDEAARATNSEDEKTKAQAPAFESRANNADLVLKDRTRQRRMGEEATLKTTPDQREDILKRAIAYLSNFGVVVAERGTNRDPEQISADQVLQLIASAKSLAAMPQDAPERAGLLTFKSKLSKAKDGALYIKARDLVKFARDARFAQTENAESKNANVQYLADLSTGMAALVASGHVEGLPKGFENGKIPSTLPLATTTYGNWSYGKKQGALERAKPADGPGDARASKEYQEAVAGEVMDDQPFVPDDTALPERKLTADAPDHIKGNRAQGIIIDGRPTQADKSKLDAESTAAVRALLEKRRATFIENGAAEKSPRIRGIDAELAKMDALESRREPDKLTVKELPKPTPKSVAAPKEGAAPVGKTQERPSGAAKRKLNAQATLLHREIGRPGFAATHDSPHRHEGKFDWRAHAGKGEGAAAFGAGTYLSTGDGVHRYYKKSFTAKVRSEETSSQEEEQAQRRLNDAQMELSHAEQRMEESGAFLVSLKTEAGSRAETFKTREEAEAAIVSHVKSIEDRLQESRRKLAAGEGNTNYIRDEAIPYSVRSLAQARKSTIEDWNERVAVLKKDVEDAKAALAAAKKSFSAGKAPTYQVSVDIPSERLLNWDKPLIEQSATIRLRAMKAIKDKSLARVMDTDDGHPPPPGKEITEPLGLGFTGRELYEELVRQFTPADERDRQKAKLKGQYAASDYLQSLGILGHTYAAVNGSQGHTPNYVIYDDSKIHTNFVAFSQQNPSNRISTQAEMDEARNYVAKVLGPQIKVDFKALTGYSGEWLEAQNVIEISTTPGPGTMQVAYHEALHAFFSKFVQANPQALEAFKALADDKRIMTRVEALLAGHPNALAQLTDGEERLAYIYQFWAAGLLDLPTKKAGILEAIREFFRKMFGLIKDSERATAILEAFHNGKMTTPSAAGEVIAKALAEGTWTTKQARKLDGLVSRVQSLALPTQIVLANSDSKTARELASRIWTNPGDEEHGDKGEGYINAKQAVATKYVNLFSGYIKGMNDKELVQVTQYLQKRTELADIPTAPHREAVKNIRALLGRFYKYMREERGMDIGKIDEGKYYPQMWDVGQLMTREKEFIAMLKKNYPGEDADAIHAALVKNHTMDLHLLPNRTDGVLSPFYASEKRRQFKWMKPEDIEPYLTKNIINTLTSYFHAGARAAEYGVRFGQKGEVLDSLLTQVRTELLDAGQQRFKRGEFKTATEAREWALRRNDQVTKSVGAIEGTLGSDIGSTWRNTNTWITVYQNVRLLPLSLFSNLVDPLSMVARGAHMSEAYDTFLRGMREVFTDWKDMLSKNPKERTVDKWEELAMAVGSVDAAMFSHHVADEYSSTYMSKQAKRVNDTFFRLNGMESWNRGVRVGATQAAVNFLQRHSKLPEVHSARWLKELGLVPADLSFAQDGSLITSKVDLAALKGITIPEAEQQIEKVHHAIRRWVQGAVITPNAAQRPAWSSDPHYSMFFHLKQFSYSFHQTILKRAVAEAGHGNIAPLGAFVWYIPAMIAADVSKGLLQGGGSLPSHMQGMSLGDWVMRAIDRSGVLGVGAIGVDAQKDLFSLGGPATEQLIDAFGQPIGRTIVDALPAKSIYAEALR